MSTTQSVLSTALTSVLGGGIVAAILTFVKDIRKGRTDYTVATYKTLAEMNDRLKAELDQMRERHRTEVDDLQTALDVERRQRRLLEDRVYRLERERGT